MSQQAVQQVIGLALTDEGFLAELTHHEALALSEFELTSVELASLVEFDWADIETEQQDRRNGISMTDLAARNLVDLTVVE